MSSKNKSSNMKRIKPLIVLFCVALISLYASIATAAVTFDHSFGEDGYYLLQDGSGSPNPVYQDYQLHGPHDVAVDSHGDIYVADFHNGEVKKYSVDGTFLGLLVQLVWAFR